MKNKKSKPKTKWEDRMPTIDLRGKNYLPEISECQIGDVVELTIKAKLTRKEEGSYDYDLMCDCDDCGESCDEQGAKKQSATFKAESIKMKKEGSKYSSKEAGIASKYTQLIKQGVKPSVAMQRARKG